MTNPSIAADLRQVLVEARSVLHTCLLEVPATSIKAAILRGKIEKISTAIRSGSGRQPIATAPRDKNILLWGRFWTDGQGWMPEPMLGHWNEHLDRWEIRDFARFGVRPVCWWPLPETPVRCASCGEPVEQEQSPSDPREWLCDACHAVATQMREDGKL